MEEKYPVTNLINRNRELQPNFLMDVSHQRSKLMVGDLKGLFKKQSKWLFDCSITTFNICLVMFGVLA